MKPSKLIVKWLCFVAICFSSIYLLHVTILDECHRTIAMQIIVIVNCNFNVVVRLEHSHSFIDSFDNHSTASGPASCRHRRPPGNAVSGHSSTMCLVVWWLSPQGQAGDAITPHR